MLGPESRTVVGDICLEELGVVVEQVHDDPPSARADTVDVPGRDGTVLRAITYEPRNITLECRVLEDRWQDFNRMIDRLAYHGLNHGLLELSLRSHPGESYSVYLSGVSMSDRIYGSGVGFVELAFVAPDPYRHGELNQITVPSNGDPVTFHVGGTVPAAVSVSARSAVRNSGSLVWGVRFDEADFVHVATGSSLTRSIAINCEDRTVVVGTGTAMITLDSDWPELWPGEHTARIDEGTGSATLMWRERSI